MEPLKLLYDLVSVYSPSGHEEEAVKVLKNWFEEQGIEAWVDRYGNLLASKVGRKNHYKVALVSHIDTVEGFWEPRLEGERVSGRGAVDAKGPLTAMSFALREIEGDVVLIAAVGEEKDSRGARGIREYMTFDYVIIGEPSDHKVVIGYRGYKWIKGKCYAKGGHASSPEVGESAIDKALNCIARIKEVSNAIVSVTRLCGGDEINVLPREAEFWLDIRYENEFEIPKCCEEISIVDQMKPAIVKPSSPVPRALARAIIRQGLKPRYVKKRGTSDMNVLIDVSKSIAAYGPGKAELSHTFEEYMELRDLERGIKTYRLAVAELLKL